MAKGMEYAESVIQPLMDRAYATWGDAKSFGEFARSLWGLERKAVLVGKLNQQVTNGGFIQWIDNGYAVLVGELFGILAEVNTPATLEALRIAREVVGDIESLGGRNGDDLSIPNSCYGDSWDDEIDFDDQDTAFYQVNEQMLIDCAEAWTSIDVRKPD